MFKPYIAEFIGSFFFAFIILASISLPQAQAPIPVPFIAAAIVALLVYTIGHLSGSHVNPAVTIAVWSIGKIGWKKALCYIVAQFAGAALAILVARGFNIGQVSGAPNNIRIAVAEGLGACFFGFGIAAVIYGRVEPVLKGIVIGGSLLIGIVMGAVLGSGGILNPMIAFSVGAFNVAYILGPIVGAVLGMQAYKYLSEKDFSSLSARMGMTNSSSQ